LIGPTNHHKYFWFTSSLLTRNRLGKFPTGHSFEDFSIASTLNSGALKSGSPEEEGAQLMI